jgi:glutamate racemase
LTLKPIGVFDSGLGGLSVVADLARVVPSEAILYFADTAHVPYGERPLSEIKDFALGITRYLVDRGAKMVVMACNMSSATALDAARNEFPDTPIIGVIQPGATAAVRNAERGVRSAEFGMRIGVLATTGTVRSGAYGRAIRELAPDAQVFEQACPLFVPLVESGRAESVEADQASKQYTTRLIDEDVMVVVLGCTHYPFLRPAVERALGKSVVVVDPAEETAMKVARILRDGGLRAEAGEKPRHAFVISGAPDGDAKFVEIGSRFLGRRIETLERAVWGVDVGKVLV